MFFFIIIIFLLRYISIVFLCKTDILDHRACVIGLFIKFKIICIALLQYNHFKATSQEIKFGVHIWRFSKQKHVLCEWPLILIMIQTQILSKSK